MSQVYNYKNHLCIKQKNETKMTPNKNCLTLAKPTQGWPRGLKGQ